MKGLDIHTYMRKNHSEVLDLTGDLTDLFTQKAIQQLNEHDKSKPLFIHLTHMTPHEPMRAPEEEVNKFSYIQNVNRRIYAAMVSILDQSVGKVVEALNENGMLDNTVTVFCLIMLLQYLDIMQMRVLIIHLEE